MELQPTIQMPHSEEAERAVLAAIWLDPERALPMARERLDLADFYFERHQLIYRSCCDLADDSRPIDLRTVQAKLEDGGKLEVAGGLAYIATLDVDLPDMGRVDVYIDVVKERAVRRRLMVHATALARNAANGDIPVMEVLEAADHEVYELMRSQQRGAQRAKSLPGPMVGMVQRILDGQPPVSPGVRTGFPRLDDATHGMRPGKFWLVAARPGRGKSALVLQFALRAARDGSGVLIFSPEMDADSLALRGLAHLSGIEIDRLGRGRIDNLFSRQTLEAAVEQVRGTSLWVYDDCPSIEEIDLRCRLHRTEQQALDVVVVDYLQLLQPSRGENIRQQVSHISRGLKALATSQRCCVLAVSQLRRLQDDWSRPSLVDLKETSQLEQDADVVLFVWADRGESDGVRDVGDLIIAKNRDGRLLAMQTVFDKAVQTFRRRAEEHEPRGAMAS